MPSIHMRAQIREGSCLVKVLIKHPMETGLRTQRNSDQTIAAHYIQQVIARHKGEVVLEADWGAAISADPFISFQIDGVEIGDEISLNWVDNQGNSDSTTTTVR